MISRKAPPYTRKQRLFACTLPQKRKGLKKTATNCYILLCAGSFSFYNDTFSIIWLSETRLTDSGDNLYGLPGCTAECCNRNFHSTGGSAILTKSPRYWNIIPTSNLISFNASPYGWSLTAVPYQWTMLTLQLCWFTFAPLFLLWKLLSIWKNLHALIYKK